MFEEIHYALYADFFDAYSVTDFVLHCLMLEKSLISMVSCLGFARRFDLLGCNLMLSTSLTGLTFQYPYEKNFVPAIRFQGVIFQSFAGKGGGDDKLQTFLPGAVLCFS